MSLSIQGQPTQELSVEDGTLPPDRVRNMFDRIAPVYDAMKRVMTAGLDQRWRRETVRAVVRPGEHALFANVVGLFAGELQEHLHGSILGH